MSDPREPPPPKPASAASALDVALCERLCAAAVGGDDDAWRSLLDVSWDAWAEIVRRSRSMGRERDEDAVRNVVVAVVSKLDKDGRAALRQFADWRGRNPDKSFLDWMRIVATNAARDYARSRLGARSPRDPEIPSPKRLLNEVTSSPLVEELGFRPPFTPAITAREIHALARGALEPAALDALELWLEGATFEDIEDALDLAEAGAGRRLVRSAVAVLRRALRGPNGTAPA